MCEIIPFEWSTRRSANSTLRGRCFRDTNSRKGDKKVPCRQITYIISNEKPPQAMQTNRTLCSRI